jgi:molybdopterin-guanine dinucleotide biosynthesis protein A
MAESQTHNVAAVVLAGGASTRMGRPKALLPFLGEPLAGRILRRLRPQAAVVYLNARGENAELAALGAPLLPDPPAWAGAGPLAGVAAALARVTTEGLAYLATAPCDAPFLPLDLVAQLMAAVNAGAPAAVAMSDFGLEPMFALWPAKALADVEAALASGRASPRSVLAGLAAAPVRFPGASFANLNTPEEFAAAQSAALQDLLQA